MGGKIDLIFDDRQKVVDMWRDKGFTVVQVAEGFLMEDMFDFLDSLRESGQINMFGAPVLVDVFEINKFEAREVLAALDEI